MERKSNDNCDILSGTKIFLLSAHPILSIYNKFESLSGIHGNLVCHNVWCNDMNHSVVSITSDTLWTSTFGVVTVRAWK